MSYFTYRQRRDKYLMGEKKKANESYFTVSRHKRGRNMLIIIPIVTVVIALTVGLAATSSFINYIINSIIY
jgi:hypothetical protein